MLIWLELGAVAASPVGTGGGPTPVADSGTLTPPVGVEMTRLPLTPPTVTGLNRTPMTQLAPLFRLAGQALPAMEKPAPLIVTPVIGTAPALGLLIVTFCVALVVPRFWLP